MHETSSRIDFFLVEHRFLENISDSSIGIATFSDHSPVSIRLKIGEKRVNNMKWRLNEELLQDKDIETRLKRELEEFLEINLTEDVSEAIVWDTHKAFVHGVLIKMGAEKNKIRRTE